MQKHNTSVKKISIQSNQYLNDTLKNIPTGCTLIQGGTGIGKTTFVLNTLTKNHRVVMLVPSRGQVNQLAQEYKNHQNMVFISGDTKKDEDLSQYQKHHIVATYDQFSRLRAAMDFENTLLVVDEAHKTYSVGSYRDRALNPILDALHHHREQFGKILLLTATYTEELAVLANMKLDTWYKVTKQGSLVRKLNVRIYENKWPHHWLKHVLDRLIDLKDRKCKKIIFVRLNNCDGIEKAAEALETQGFKTLNISSETMDSPIVKAALETQRLPKEYDVILTTSILDEAINFKNQDVEIDSVHIVNATAHPEEIVQFMGRLRSANPPFYLHLQKDESFLEALATPATQDATECFARLKEEYDELVAFAEACRRLSKRSITTNTPQDFVKVMNTTVGSIVGCPLLRFHNRKICTNNAGILAACYRVDISQIYARYERLKHRLTTLLPTLQMSVSVITDKPCANLDRLLVKVAEAQKDNRDNAITEICHDVDANQQASCLSLEQFGQQRLEEINADSTTNPYDIATHPLKNATYLEVLSLTQHLENIKDIERAMMAEHTLHVIRLSKSFQEDVFLNNVRATLDLWISSKQKPNKPLTVKAGDAAIIVQVAFEQTCYELPPFKSAVIKKRRWGISLDPKTQAVIVNTQKAMNLIAKTGWVDEKNARKPQQRYLILKGINWMGYAFLRTPDSKIYDTKESELDREEV